MRLTLITLILSCISLYADQIHLKDGSIIKGDITQVHKNTLSISSSSLGQISVKMGNVSSYKIDKKANVRFADGTEKTQTYNSQKDSPLSTLWLGKGDPDVFTNKHETRIAANINKSTGNTDESNLSISAKYSYLREFDTLSIGARYINNTSNDQRTTDEKAINVDYERRFGEQSTNSWYARLEVLEDNIKDIKLRNTLALGYGLYLIKKDKTSLRLRSGLLFRDETHELDTSSDSQSIGVDFGLNFNTKLTDTIAWYTDLNWSPLLEDFTDYRLTHESGISIPLSTDIPMFIKAGVNHQRNNRPAQSRSKLDTLYFMKLEIVL